MDSFRIAIRILSIKYLMLCIVFAITTSSLVAQEQDPLKFIDSLRMIIDQEEIHSYVQQETETVLHKRALSELNNNKHLSKKERARLQKTIHDLVLKKRTYTALVSKNEISKEVLAYEEKLQALSDSMTFIQEQLIAAIENPVNTYRTKEKAVYVLARIHKEEVIEYLLEKEKRLQFGTMDPENWRDYDEEVYRTAMIALCKEYLYPEINWMVFPFILEYLETAGFSEMGVIRQFSGYGKKGYRDAWYLLKFMEANASPELKTIIEGELRNLNNPTERE